MAAARTLSAEDIAAPALEAAADLAEVARRLTGPAHRASNRAGGQPERLLGCLPGVDVGIACTVVTELTHVVHHLHAVASGYARMAADPVMDSYRPGVADPDGRPLTVRQATVAEMDRLADYATTVVDVLADLQAKAVLARIEAGAVRYPAGYEPPPERPAEEEVAPPRLPDALIVIGVFAVLIAVVMLLSRCSSDSTHALTAHVLTTWSAR